MIPGCPNRNPYIFPLGKRTQGTKTFKYLQEEKAIAIPLLGATEKGLDQTEFLRET